MAAAPKPRVVLLDIEGTVCPISFVKDVLFPYALTALDATLAAEWSTPAFAPYIAAFPPEHAATPSALAAHVRDLMARDVKIAYLKSLQGYLWETGYAAGALKAPLFPDVAPRIAAWTSADEPVTVMIYSSGSVAAQKLLFAHTDGDPADLRPLLADYFDTVNAGPKQERASYERIAAAHPEFPRLDEWLFLSDNVAEVRAAKEAGMQAVVVDRLGNAEVGQEDRRVHMVVTSFDQL
ncbi:HAD-like domain-containing protein [Staphylotrichum tortipilum]|uniref:Enolase-phosphatase E1 n=1 Tax=Staphylotrichum tortipilum TaxID=2831512 RepID=A0AAN6RTZ8_9PEZI|nr:HAD-like domain-containing protein [Staphylotrichum longicolle]